MGTHGIKQLKQILLLFAADYWSMASIELIEM